MMSGATYEGVKNNIDARHLGVIRVVGKAESVSIYELMGVKGSLPDKIYDMLEKYDQGRECFLRQDWKEARLMFRQGLKIVPDDGPCGEYIDLCDAYMKNPPKRGWDGVFVLKGK
jgi:adenylate cyclase